VQLRDFVSGSIQSTMAVGKVGAHHLNIMSMIR